MFSITFYRAYFVLSILFLVNTITAEEIQPVTNNKTFTLADYHPYADGITDDTPAFQQLFEAAKDGGVVTIPPGDYFMKGENILPIPSNTTVFAYGANFYLPKNLGDKARIKLFQGTDVSNFSWFGGFFKGWCFDTDISDNTWEPNVNTRIFVITTSKTGKTDQLNFRDIRSDKVAGAVVNVNGFTDKADSAENTDINFATNVTVENCTLLKTGNFLWDYGFLWQVIVFSDEHTPSEVAMAKKYFRNDLVRENIKITDGSDKVYFENTKTPIRSGEVLCFYDDQLPANIIRGKRYFVVESTPEFIKVSDDFNGKPIVFKGSAGQHTKIIYKLSDAFGGLWCPIGMGPGKGCIDLVRCKNTKILECTISSLGDAMHVYNCHNNLISNNQILSARMGAFFLAEYSKNSTITGNTVDGMNGSRIVSIERSNEDVTVAGNVFRNGGRGSWINQPKNLVIQGNVFINNTNKNIKDHHQGRRDFRTGGWQMYPEIYFTTYQKDATYGPVIISNNIFITGSDAVGAIHFAENGKDVQVSGNTFKGTTGLILMDEDNGTITIDNNQGAVVKKGKNHSMVFSNQ
jgi:parallel beta-helix repeat protein